MVLGKNVHIGGKPQYEGRIRVRKDELCRKVIHCLNLQRDPLTVCANRCERIIQLGRNFFVAHHVVIPEENVRRRDRFTNPTI